MPRKPKLAKSEAPLAPVPPEILDQFVGQGPLTPDELEAAVRRFKKAIIERALGGELTHHLGYPPGGAKPDATTNHRNGTSGIAVTDGLKGMSEALAAVFPATTLQTCIVHLIRNSLEFANWKERKALAAALRAIYTAPSAEAAGAALDAFERGPWGAKFPTVIASTPSFGRSSRPAGTFQLTTRRPSSFGWRCGTLPPHGNGARPPGVPPCGSLRFSLKIASWHRRRRMNPRMDLENRTRRGFPQIG